MKRAIFCLTLIALFALGITQLSADQCKGEMTCNDGEVVKCDVKLEAGQLCEVSYVTNDHVLCMVYDRQGAIEGSDMGMCWPDFGIPDDGIDECDFNDLGGAWWVGCDPAPAY